MKHKFKILPRALLSVLFIVSVCASLLLIFEYYDFNTSELKQSKVGNEVLLPDFIPNSVLYSSNEKIRVYKTPTPAASANVVVNSSTTASPSSNPINDQTTNRHFGKNQSNEKRSLGNDKDNNSDNNADNNITKSRIPPGYIFPKYLSGLTGCYTVASPEAYYLTEYDNSLRYSGSYSYWMGVNQSHKYISALFRKSGIDFYVVFLPPFSKIMVKIRPDRYSLIFANSKDPCVNPYDKRFGYLSEMPEAYGSSDNDQYINSIYHTKMDDYKSAFFAKTFFYGHMN